MTKQEFLEELRSSLTGAVSAESVMDAYRYYSDYIDKEIRAGKPESQVIEELGKPALIAKSIIAASAGERQADVEYTEDGKTKKVHQGKANYEKREEKVKREFHFNLYGWYARVIGILLFLLLVVIVFFILKWSLILLVTFGVPILILLGIIYLVMYFIRE